MTKDDTILLESLIGRHTFTGFDRIQIPNTFGFYNAYTSADAVIFILDGITYIAIEDPDDGYRSNLHTIFITTEIECKNKIPTHIVEGRRRKDNQYEQNDTIEFIDILTNSVVMAIGTDNWNDYYPYCVMEFTPEELAINKDKKKYTSWLRQHKLERVLYDA